MGKDYKVMLALSRVDDRYKHVASDDDVNAPIIVVCGQCQIDQQPFALTSSKVNLT